MIRDPAFPTTGEATLLQHRHALKGGRDLYAHGQYPGPACSN
jgi:hypothetical protein